MADAASIFVSYSHADKPLARALADALRAQGLKVWIDDDELKIGDSLIERIATAIAGIDFFLVLVSEASRDSNWCRKELSLAVTGELSREGVRVLPVRVRGAAMPDALGDKVYLDLHEGNVGEVATQIAEAVPRHQAEQREAISERKKAARASATVAAKADDEFEPIKIIGIVEEGVGRPRNDGSRGSALYRVPLRLSRKPPSVWAEHLPNVWDHPPSWTSMHRPGIASVVGDTIVLDGTTMDELEKYHVETLKGVIDKVNADVAAQKASERARHEREEAKRRAHEQGVRDAAERIPVRQRVARGWQSFGLLATPLRAGQLGGC